MDRKKMSITLAGHEFRVSSGDAGYLRSLEAELNRRVREAKAKYPGETTQRAILLAMLEMEDELISLRNEVSSVDRKIEELKRVRIGAESRRETPEKRPFERKKPVGVR